MPFSRIPRRALALGVVVAALPGSAALAADLLSDADLGSSAALPTEIAASGSAITKTFTIKVWATGNVSGATSTYAVNKYSMPATGGAATPSASSADQTNLSFRAGQYNPNATSTICTGTPQPLGCAANPHVVSATLTVAAGSTAGTTGSVRVELGPDVTGLNNIEGGEISASRPQSEDVGYIRFVAPVVTDATAPSVSVTPPPAPSGQSGYFNAADIVAAGGSISVPVSASDTSNVTGISCTDSVGGGAPTTLTVAGQTGSNPRIGTVSVSSDGTHVITCTATDGASNSGASNAPNNAGTVKIDKTDPNVACGPAPTAWSASDVSIACSASDGVSGLAIANAANFDLSTNVANATETSNASTGSRTVSDAAGNHATAGPVSGIRVDKKAPSYNCDTAPTTWSAADISVDCTAQDHGSGLSPTTDASFSLSTTVPAGTETSNAATGTKTLKDAVDNENTAGPISGLMVDRKAPAVSCDSAPTFLRNQSPANVTAAFTDGGSGPGSGSASAAANTSTVGGKTVSVAKSDNVGNTGSALCGYRVGFEFVGFSSPLNNPTWINKLKAGQAVPFKWRLLDANGPVTDLGAATMAVGNLNCGTPTDGFDPVEELAAGSSGLQNMGDGYYQVNWKSLSTYAGSCRTVALNLGEGITRPAWFQFTK